MALLQIIQSGGVSSGGGGTPGGSDTQIQFNDAGSFGGTVDLVWDKITSILTFPNGSQWGPSGVQFFEAFATGSNAGMTVTAAAPYDSSSPLVRFDGGYSGTGDAFGQQTLSISHGNSGSFNVTGTFGIDIAAVNGGGGTLDGATGIIITPGGTNYTGIAIESSPNAITPIRADSGISFFAEGFRYFDFSTGPTQAAGTGSPEGVVTATVSSIWMRTDGGTNTSLYVKESGSGNTGWVAKSTPQLPITIAATASNWLRSYDSTTGLFTKSQPDFTDISGTASVAQIPSLPASKITSGQLALARGGTNADLSATGGTSFVLRQSSAGAAITVSQLAYSDISGSPASGTVLWNALGNASGALSLSNAGNATTFNQTSAVIWSWLNTTAATNVLSQSSPIHKLGGRYWTSAADAEDSWSLQNVVANGSNGTSILTFTHAGSTGAASVNVPKGAVGTTGAWGLGFGDATIGLGASAAILALVTNNTSTYPAIRMYRGSSYVSGIVTSTSSSVDFLSIGMNSNPGCVILGADIRTAINITGVLIGADFGNNGNLTPTSGTTVGVSVGAGAVTGAGGLVFSPTSGAAAFVPFQVNAKVNQTSTASGNYTALKVNMVETALLGSANLLLDLQAGTTGGTSQFAINNSGVMTKYKAITTVGDGQPYEVATIDLTAQTAAKAATTVYTPTFTGWYRLSVYLKVTTASAGTSILGGATGVTITYTDGTDSVAQSVVMSMTKQDGTVGIVNNGNGTTTILYGSIAVYAKTGVAIQYAIDYTSVGGTMNYAARGRLEAL